jgi:hypothetical protein
VNKDVRQGTDTHDLRSLFAAADHKKMMLNIRSPWLMPTCRVIRAHDLQPTMWSRAQVFPLHDWFVS